MQISKSFPDLSSESQIRAQRSNLPSQLCTKSTHKLQSRPASPPAFLCFVRVIKSTSTWGKTARYTGRRTKSSSHRCTLCSHRCRLWQVVMATQQHCHCRWFIVGALVCQPVSPHLLIIGDTQITDILHHKAMTHVHHFFSVWNKKS